MPQSIHKAMNGLRKIQSLEEPGVKKVRVDSGNLDLHDLSCSPEQALEPSAMLFTHPAPSSSQMAGYQMSAIPFGNPTSGVSGLNNLAPYAMPIVPSCLESQNPPNLSPNAELLDDASVEEVSPEKSGNENDDEMHGNGEDTPTSEKAKALRDQIDILRSRLQATLQEAERVKKERNEIVSFMMQGLQNARRDVMNSEKQLEAYRRLAAARVAERRNDNISCSNNQSADPQGQRTVKISQMDARLIALISIFLSVHRLGAQLDYICNYLINLIPSANVRDVEVLMKRFPTVFKEETTGVGASAEKIWKYMGFQS